MLVPRECVEWKKRDEESGTMLVPPEAGSRSDLSLVLKDCTFVARSSLKALFKGKYQSIS